MWKLLAVTGAALACTACLPKYEQPPLSDSTATIEFSRSANLPIVSWGQELLKLDGVQCGFEERQMVNYDEGSYLLNRNRATPVRVPGGERAYFALRTVSVANAQVASACQNLVSFDVIPGHRYTMEHRNEAGRCRAYVVDATTGAEPAGLRPELPPKECG